MTSPAAGRRVADRYLLERPIAVGGMGEVWEASDTRLGRRVAVKVLRTDLSGDPEFLHRFRIEARTVAALDHPGIAAVYDYGEDEPVGGVRTAYLVMELVRGEPLSARIARGPLQPDETLRVLEQAAHALQVAHTRGTVHRDVKPGNILIRDDGQVKITDFGIAKAADAVPLTRAGMVMGTAHYLAPEQASGGEAGPAGDVYSLGVVGFECLAGHRPFRGDSTVAVATMQVRDAPPPLPAGVPAPVRELIEAVLVKDPARRYGCGGELAAAVAAVRRGAPLPPAAGARDDGGRRAAAQRAPAARTDRAGTAAPVTARPGTGPMHLAPAAGPSRGVLLVLFVLLTAAALAVGWFLLAGRSAEQETSGSAPAMSTAGTVQGREDIITGSAAVGPVAVPTAARRTSETGPPALGWGARHPIQGGRPA